MKTTVELPREILDEVERRAAYLGRKVDDAVAYYLVKGLAISPAPPAGLEARISTDPATGLPVILGSTAAPARWMTTEALIDLEHDTLTLEDLERLGLSPGQ